MSGIVVILKKLKSFLIPPQNIIEQLRHEGMVIGTNCEIFSDVNFGSEPCLIQLGDFVKITTGSRFITHDGGVFVLRNLGWAEDADKFGRIIIGNNVFIGNNCIVLPGVTVGDNVVIGAGSVVTKDIPSNSIAAGVSCRTIKTVEKYYNDCKDTLDFTKHMNQIEKKEYLYRKYGLSKNKEINDI